MHSMGPAAGLKFHGPGTVTVTLYYSRFELISVKIIFFPTEKTASAGTPLLSTASIKDGKRTRGHIELSKTDELIVRMLEYGIGLMTYI